MEYERVVLPFIKEKKMFSYQVYIRYGYLHGTDTSPILHRGDTKHMQFTKWDIDEATGCRFVSGVILEVESKNPWHIKGMSFNLVAYMTSFPNTWKVSSDLI